MSCFKCGKEHNNEGLYCPECAAEMVENQASAVEPVEEPTPDGIALLAAPEEALEVPAKEACEAPAEAPKKKKKGLLIALAIATVALVGSVVALLLNWNNWFGPKSNIPENPAEYVAFLAEPRIESAKTAVTDAYGKWLQTQSGPQCVDTTVEMEISDEVLSLLAEVASGAEVTQDLSWLRDITLDIRSNEAPDRSALETVVKLLIGQEHIMTLDEKVRLEDMAAYLAVPELNQQYLKLNENGVLSDTDSWRMNRLLSQIKQELPEAEGLNATVAGIGDILLRYTTKNVTKASQTITVNGVQQKVTALQSKLSGQDQLELIQALLSFLKEDEAARAFAKAVMSHSDDFGISVKDMELSMDIYDQLMDEAIATLEEEKKDVQAEDYLVLDTYASGEQVLGYGLRRFANGIEDSYVWGAVANVDGVFHLEICADQDFRLVGTGALGESGLFDGEFTVYVDGEVYLTLKLEGVNLLTGYGKYILVSTEALLDSLGLGSLAKLIAAGLSVELELWDGGGRLVALGGQSSLFSANVKTSASVGQSLAFPESYVDVSDANSFQGWMIDVKLDGVVQALKNAGLPKENHEAVDNAVKQWNLTQMEARLIGAWTVTMDLAPRINAQMAAAEPDVAAYGMTSFQDLYVTINLNFYEDGTFLMEADKASIEQFFKSMKAQFASMIRKPMEEELKGSGYTLDELLALMGMTMEEFIDEMLPKEMETQFADGIYNAGTFEVREDGTVCLGEKFPGCQLVDGKLMIQAPEGEEYVILYPIELTKVE